MRKELHKCKYELITSPFSYIVFDEQTSGAALASIIRQQSKLQGRLLSVTFKSNDIWEVHTVISLYAVTNAKSGKKYARSHNSQKDANIKLTKALHDEIQYLQETYGDAPITISSVTFKIPFIRIGVIILALSARKCIRTVPCTCL